MYLDFRHNADPTRCRHAVHNTYGVDFHQCTRKARYFSQKDYGYCKQHAQLRGIPTEDE